MIDPMIAKNCWSSGSRSRNPSRLLYTAIRDAILTHPTMAESLNSLFGNLPSGFVD